MTKLTTEQIEQLAGEIRQFLLDNHIWQDTTIYFNGRAYSTTDGNGNYAYNDPVRLFVLDGKDPADYIQYTASPHILSMAFEGPLCGCLNFYNECGADFDNRIINGFSAILDRYGLYYEMGEHWNLSCYPIHDSDKEQEKVPQAVDTVITFRGDFVEPADSIIPEPLPRIQEIWKEKANIYGDAGACVLGAGFHFTYQGGNYFMPPISRWQGSISWEHFVGEITELLKEVGATNIRYEYGRMD